MISPGDIVTDIHRSLFQGKQGEVIDDSKLPWRKDGFVTVIFSPNCLPVPDVAKYHPEGFLALCAESMLIRDEEWRIESVRHKFCGKSSFHDMIQKKPEGRCIIGSCNRTQERVVWAHISGVICRMTVCVSCADVISKHPVLDHFPHRYAL